MKDKPVTVQEKYNSFLNDYLGEKLFETAKNLNKLLVNSFSISPSNARQILKRAVAQRAIKSSHPYTFGNGQYVYIFNDHFLDKTAIKAITQISRKPIFRLLHLLDINDGILSYYEGLKVTASPVEESSTKVDNLEDILTLLRKLDLVYLKRSDNNVNYIIYKIAGEELSEIDAERLMANHFSKMVTDANVIPDILRWLKNSNLVSSGPPIYRNKKSPSLGAAHNNLVWDALSYTATTGINPVLKSQADSLEKQTLVVLDVILSREYEDVDLDGFYNRIQINRNSVLEKTRKVLPIIIYSSWSEHVRNKVAKLGFLSFDIGSIFGTRIYDILNKTTQLPALLKEPDSIDKRIEEILSTITQAGQEDALKELRGTLFEFLMYPLLTRLYPNAYIERARIITSINGKGEKEAYEYDYIIQSSNPPEIVFVELKGYHSAATISLGDKNTKSTLKWFFRRTLPFAIKDYEAEIKKGKEPKAVYMTSANFWDDGRDFIEKMNLSKYKSAEMNCGYERETLIKLLEAKGFKNEVKIIKKFYSKDD